VATLIANGTVTYPFLGVTPAALDPVTAAANGLTIDYGAYVTAVAAGSPAATAGIQQGDIVLAIDSTKIDQQHSFTEALFSHKPGDTVTVTLERGSQQMTVKVTLGQRSSTSSAATS
jgi:S1-C subfamily serine protease